MRKSILTWVFLSLVLIALLLGACTAASGYPDSSQSAEGWTGESSVSGAANPNHVRIASSDSWLYSVSEEGYNIVFRRSSDGGKTWVGEKKLDYAIGNVARDPYFCARPGSSEVCVCWKEYGVNGCAKSAWVFRNSTSNGADWYVCQYDASANWNNYEGHIVEDDAGNVFCAYVSDYSGRNEVFFRRRFPNGAWTSAFCVSDPNDSVSASLPSVDCGGSTISIFYQYGDASPHQIWQAWSFDNGAAFNRGVLNECATDDCSWPECANVNGVSFVTFQGKNIYDNTYSTYVRYWTGTTWTSAESIKNTGNSPCYPQISAYPGAPLNKIYVLVTMRDSLTGGGFGKLSLLTAQQGQWNDLTGLFYGNLPADGCSPTHCLIDANGFYAVSAGTGAQNKVMFKRMDGTAPNLSFSSPSTSPSYYKTDFQVTLDAFDNWDVNGTSFLSPNNEAYQRGIVHADLEYAPHGSESFQPLPGYGNKTKADAPWAWNFNVAAAGNGRYDLRATVYDTAGNFGQSRLNDLFVDTVAPVVGAALEAPNGSNGWYSRQPTGGVTVTANDAAGSGIDSLAYRFDGAGGWTVFSTPFELLEGEHTLQYYAVDKAQNQSAIGEYPYKLDLSNPQATLASPTPGSYFRQFLQAEISANDTVSGVAKAELWLNDACIGQVAAEPWFFSIDLSARPDSEYGLKAVVYDQAGRNFSAPVIAVRKDATPPVTQIVEPSGEHWLRGMVTIQATIMDNFEVTGADFYVGEELIDRRTSYPWTAAWDTSTIQNGYHQIKVVARDRAGNESVASSSGEVKIYVGNNISETSNYAEGCTRAGFDTWLCLQNPGAEQADVTINYMLGEGQGAAPARIYAVPPHSRMTVYVNQDVGPEKDVSMQVTSSKPIVSERPMYFTYRGKWQGSHTALGAHFPLREWYFAEGCTRAGFEEWLCIQNPLESPADVTIDYMLENGDVQRQYLTLQAWSRYTVEVNQVVGDGRDVSARISANQPVVAERPMYFLYQGMWDGGHNVMGASRPQTNWYFAEGCTRPGFNEWLCIQNPNDKVAQVDMAYMTEDGGEIAKHYQIAAHSRYTINVNTDVARYHDVSARVTSDLPVVAERPMYFDYRAVINEGSNAMGVNKPSSSWYLAEGCTRDGFEEWICLQNPGQENATARITYMLGDSTTREQIVDVPAHSRKTVRVNDIVGPGQDVSAQIMSDAPIIVERPMYSMYRGSCPAADTLAGYTFDQ